MIVHNIAGPEGKGFESDDNKINIIFKNNSSVVKASGKKQTLAIVIFDEIEKRIR